jgi:hypothetical protein
MTIQVDVPRAREAASLLMTAWNSTGILGDQSMPEDLAPQGVETGSSAHALFLTLTVAIDYMRDADQLWTASRATYEDPNTRYLFDPHQVTLTPNKTVERDLSIHGLTRKPIRDADIWITLCRTFQDRYQGKVESLMAENGWKAPAIAKYVSRQEQSAYFPNLRGPKISLLWVRMMNDNWKGHRLVNLDQVELPVDVHTAAATVMGGYVNGNYKGDFPMLREAVQAVWRKACQGTELYPLQLDEPLWHLSRNGCRKTKTMPCEYEASCPVGHHCTGTWLQTSGTPGNEIASVGFTTGQWKNGPSAASVETPIPHSRGSLTAAIASKITPEIERQGLQLLTVA